jgi:hypothetical protein
LLFVETPLDGVPMVSQRHEIHDTKPGAYNRFSVVVLLVLSALLMLRQLASTSYFTVDVGDVFIYPSWAWQFKEALKEGVIYPRWLPLNFWGYGSPTFLLYPPLAFYMVALFNVFTDSILTAMNMAKFSSLFLSGVGIYFLVKEFYPARVALMSSIFFIILPFNIFLLYVIGSFAATISCLWFSPILLFIHKYFKSGEYRYLFFSGACYGALILTHLVIAYMFTFVITAFVIYMVVREKKPGSIALLPVIPLTGLFLSAAYILPVLFEKKYVNPEALTSGSNGFIYSNMFILPNLTARFGERMSWPVYYNTIVLHTAIFCLLIMISLIRYLDFPKLGVSDSTGAVNKFFLLTAGVSIILMFGISSFLWETIPFFKYILFPPRWMHITAFAVSFLSATLFTAPHSAHESNRKHLILPLVLFSLCLALDISYIIEAPGYDEKKILPAIAVNNVMEHLPKEVSINNIGEIYDTGDNARFTFQGLASAKVLSWKSANRIVDVKAEIPVVMRFRTFYFPGWTAYIDGAPSEISAETGTRAIMINVPKGNHRLELVFEDTPARRYGKLISLVSFAFLSIWVITSQFLSKKSETAYQRRACKIICVNGRNRLQTHTTGETDGHNRRTA